MIIVWQTAGLCTTIKTWNCCFRKYFKRLDGKQAKRFLWQIDLFSIYMTLKTRKLTLRNFSAVCMLTFPLIPIFLALYGLHLFLTILLFCFYFSLDYKNFCISILADFFFFFCFSSPTSGKYHLLDVPDVSACLIFIQFMIIIH